MIGEWCIHTVDKYSRFKRKMRPKNNSVSVERRGAVLSLYK